MQGKAILNSEEKIKYGEWLIEAILSDLERDGKTDNAECIRYYMAVLSGTKTFSSGDSWGSGYRTGYRSGYDDGLAKARRLMNALAEGYEVEFPEGYEPDEDKEV